PPGTAHARARGALRRARGRGLDRARAAGQRDRRVRRRLARLRPTSPGYHSSGMTPLREVASYFLRLGVVAFGGPAAHIAMMREELVRRRHWVNDQQFLDLLGITNLIPGPNSTEMASHLGP